MTTYNCFDVLFFDKSVLRLGEALFRPVQLYSRSESSLCQKHCVILTHHFHHSMAQESAAALQVTEALDVQRPDIGTGVSVCDPLRQISAEKEAIMNFSNTKLQKRPAVTLPYFPAPPANERPDEFMPANTKYPYMPGVSPIRQRMSGVKDSGQLTSCWISQASSPGIRRSRALNMGSVGKQQTHNTFIERTARA